ncbi:hypothetical protein BKK81_32400 [Cupriavidus sp. USMAHM13]|uniref:Sigma-70 family RNA polymerase sigma factor n=1 Tax=Cupriavidus malaysiensis TaxID=367825 RepID=A0ABM6FB57_9BURK|nr:MULTISPECIES: sigma-70 family RNA polymerase sigma factor [Cupriavidus]AOZ03712.1 hypothetical protein BKK81_32400 [Cupriavidus sp. USMAHM13]AOZ08925.1 hypothetical protein BKK80_23920 [Cupriavidus malaysiensis]
MDMSIPHCVRAPEPLEGAPGAVGGAATGAVTGEEAAAVVLREILVTNYDRLHRRLMRQFGCRDTASDSLQEAWLRLGSATVSDAVRCAEAYVYRVACNVATDQLRDRNLWPSLVDPDLVFEHLADRGPGPDAVAEARSDLAALDRALQQVPGRHRRVLVGLRLEELTREEVAARDGISLRNVDTALRQALDHCAALTGRRAVGGVSAPRRTLARAGGAGSVPAPAEKPVRRHAPKARSEAVPALWSGL